MKRSIILILCIFIVSGCTLSKKEDNTKPGEKINGMIEKQEKKNQSINSNKEKAANERKNDVDVLNKQLIKAAENRDTESIENLLKEGADINTRDSNGRTPTMIATYNNDTQSASVLINAGADVNIQDNIKNNPFLYAGAEGYIEILRLTIKAGADSTLTNRYGGTALIPASEHGYIDVIEELLTKTDINVNHINNLGWTALLESIVLNDGDKQQQQTVRLLIEHGADVNIRDKNGVSPLEHARRKGFGEIEDILFKAGAK